jgi:hypothetical protein
MKYSIQNKSNKKRFPVTVTLSFETQKEYVHFHDKVMQHLIPNTKEHKLYADVFRVGAGHISSAHGEIEAG